MDLDRNLLWALLVSRDHYDRIVGTGIGPTDCDTPETRRAFGFIADHVRDYGTLPGAKALVDLCGVAPEDPGTDPGYVLAEVRNRKLFRQLREGIESAMGAMRGNDPDGAFAGLQAFVESSAVQEQAPPKTLFESGAEVVATYERMLQGYVGVPYPWPGMTAMTQGMWPGTLTMFVGRPGMGKSITLVLLAQYAWREAHRRVLIISPEMSRMEVAERFFAIHARVSQTGLVRGTLTEWDLQRLKGVVADLAAADGIWIMDQEDDLSPRSIEARIRAVKPEVVLLDTLYNIRVPGNRFERTERALEWSLNMAKRHAFALVAFSQQNRNQEVSAKLGGGTRLGTIAFSDQVGMDAHAVFAMEQDADMKLDRRMRYVPLKIRRGYSEGPVEINWDFTACNFTEIAKAGKVGYNDDGFRPGPVDALPAASPQDDLDLPF
jgi:KaiC/GvpD/RAD55 family RecA-like ATPase